MPSWLIVVLLLIGYAVFEFINGIFFNYKLFLINDKKYVETGIFNALSTLMLLTSFIVSVFFSINDGSDPIWWFIPLTALFMGFGNFFAAITVPYIKKYIENKKTIVKENKKKKEK